MSKRKPKELVYTYDPESRTGTIKELPWFYRYRLKKPLNVTLEQLIINDVVVWKACIDEIKICGAGRDPQQAIHSAALQLLIELENHTQLAGPLSQYAQRVPTLSGRKR